MSTSNESATPSINRTTTDIQLEVGLSNGKTSRLVVAKLGDLTYTDTINVHKASARKSFVKGLAEAWGIEDSAMLCEMQASLPQKANEADALFETLMQDAKDRKATMGEGYKSANMLKNTSTETVDEAMRFLRIPTLFDELASDFARLGIAGEIELATTAYIVATSRLLEKPLGATIKASSATGKSFISEQITSLMPEEQTLAATDITANALYYMPQNQLKHKLIVIGERKQIGGANEADVANATLALREMLSRGKLDKYVPMSIDGVMTTVHITQEGPIAYLDTTTQQEIYEEDSTRLIGLTTDESSDQTAAIMDIQGKEAAWLGASPDEQEAIRQKHKAVQRLLVPRKVCIPFARMIRLSSECIIARRAFPQLLACIRAVGLLRQFQHYIADDDYIIATTTDYRIAYELMRPVLRRAFAPLSDRALKLLAVLRAQAPEGQIFVRSDCVEWAKVKATEVNNRLRMLVDAGLVEVVNGSKGAQYKYRVVNSRACHVQGLGLITPVELRARWKDSRRPKLMSKREEVESNE